MTLLMKLLVALRLRKEPTIETITSPMGKIVAKLTAYAEAQKAQADLDAEAALKLKEQSDAEAKAAQEALALSARYSALTV